MQPTISEDTADGQTAKSDALLKLLSDDKICFCLPTDELNDAELDIPESKFYRPGAGPSTLSGRVIRRAKRPLRRRDSSFPHVKARRAALEMATKRPFDGDETRSENKKREKEHDDIQSLSAGGGNTAGENHLGVDMDGLDKVGKTTVEDKQFISTYHG